MTGLRVAPCLEPDPCSPSSLLTGRYPLLANSEIPCRFAGSCTSATPLRLANVVTVAFRSRLSRLQRRAWSLQARQKSSLRPWQQRCIARRTRRVRCPRFPCWAPRLLIVRVFSSTLLPGFFGPESSVLPVNLPPSVPPRFGVSSSSRFAVVAGNLPRQDRRASLGKTPHLPRSRPASRWVDYSGYQASRIHACSAFSPPPSSRFAVRYVPGFCLMLPPDIPFLVMPLPCWRSLSVRSRQAVYFQPPAGRSAWASCQAHIKDPRRKRTGYSGEVLFVLRHHGFSNSSLCAVTPQQATGSRVD